MVRPDPEAAPEADPDYHQKSRGILVQPIPEPRPICHIEYEVGYSYYYMINHGAEKTTKQIQKIAVTANIDFSN